MPLASSIQQSDDRCWQFSSGEMRREIRQHEIRHCPACLDRCARLVRLQEDIVDSVIATQAILPSKRINTEARSTSAGAELSP